METSKMDQMLIVIAISEGRNFPKKEGWQLIMEARLDGECISTDPVNHEENPQFNTELAWEVDKKGFRLFRMQRIPIKLQCFAIEEDNPKVKESLGYVVVDLRTVHPKPQSSKWHLLVNPKYYWMKPEIRFCVSLEKDNGGIIEDRTLPVRSSPTSKNKSQFAVTSPKLKLKLEPQTKNLDPELLKPILNEEEGFYQIGPTKENNIFSLSVTIVFAANLDQLTPSDVRLPDNHDGFYFYYSLLTNDVTTDTFPDLMDPSFAAERATVRIRSSIEILREFLKLQPGIKIHLCTGDISLGCAHVSLVDLLPANSTEIFMNPVSLEGMYEINSMDEKELKKIPRDIRPFVGLSVSLRVEDQQARVIIEQPPVLNGKEARPSTPPQSSTSPVRFPQSPPVKLGAKERKNSPSVFGDQTRLMAGHDEIDFKSVLHHYCFTLDMRFIRLTNIENKLFCFLRYNYHFFGTATTIVTHPLMEISRGSEVTVPRGFCSFSFAHAPDHVSRAFHSLPLHVEVVKRDKERNEDVIIGMVRLDLSKVLSVGKTRIVSSENKTGVRQTVSESVVIHSLDDKMKILGNLKVVIGLDDFGPTVLPAINLSPENHENHSTKLSSFPKVDNIPRKTKLEERDIGEYLEITEDQREMAMEFAQELEEWKRLQQEEFRKEIKAKESYYMESLVNEWRKRDTEREVTFQRKLRECKELEDKLRLALSDATKREKILTEKEIEVDRMKNDLELKRDQQQNEIKMGYLRLRDEFEHQLQVERQRCLENEKQKEKLMNQVNDLERKLEEKCVEFENWRQSGQVNPQLKLKSELNLVNLEKTELERKLEAATKSKVHYKQQWGRSLRELARIKQKLEADARAHLFRQQQELEDMRLQYLAAEQEENKTMSTLSEVNKFREPAVKKTLSEGVENVPLKNSKQISFLDFSDDESDEVSRTDVGALVKERETLLSSGIYVESDRIIKELDKEIEMVRSKSKNVLRV